MSLPYYARAVLPKTFKLAKYIEGKPWRQQAK